MLNLHYDQIMRIDKTGITFDTEDGNVRIYFTECARNFEIEWSGGSGKCIGTRDILAFMFTFYATPKVNVFCKRKGFWREKFFLYKRCSMFHNDRRKDFRDLQKKIIELGYSTYDLS